MEYEFLVDFLTDKIKERHLVNKIIMDKYQMEHQEKFQMSLDLIKIWKEEDEEEEEISDYEEEFYNYYKTINELFEMDDGERMDYYEETGLDPILYEYHHFN